MQGRLGFAVPVGTNFRETQCSRRTTRSSSEYSLRAEHFSALGTHHSAHTRPPRLLLLVEWQSLHLLQGDPQHAAEGEALGEAVRDAQTGADELEKVERRLAPGQDEDELAREVLAVVGVQVQWLEVIAEVHAAQRRPAARAFQRGDA